MHVLAAHLGLRVRERRFQVRQILELSRLGAEHAVRRARRLQRLAAGPLGRARARSPPRPAAATGVVPGVPADRGARPHLGAPACAPSSQSSRTRRRPPGWRRITFQWSRTSKPERNHAEGRLKPASTTTGLYDRLLVTGDSMTDRPASGRIPSTAGGGASRMMPSMSTHRTTRVLPRARSTDMTIAAVTMMNSIVRGYRKTRATSAKRFRRYVLEVAPLSGRCATDHAWSLLPTLSAPSELTRASPARLNEFSPFHRVVLRLLFTRGSPARDPFLGRDKHPIQFGGRRNLPPDTPLSGSSFTIHYRPLRSHPSAQVRAGDPGCRGREIAVEACCVRASRSR